MIHGNYDYRLPVGSCGTSEEFGFSMWHLVAAGMLEQPDLVSFLMSAAEVDNNTLIDDLREKMAVFGISSKHWWVTQGQFTHFDLTFEQFKQRTSWKTPLEICVEFQRPLILGPDPDWEFPFLHPVIYAAHKYSRELIGKRVP